MAINTVVAIFLNGGKLLMERRSGDRKVYAGFLMCPSGHVEVGETLEQALAREMQEELGIRVTASKPLFSIDDTDPFSKKDFTHNFMRVERYTGDISETKEGVALLWLSYNQIKNENPVLIVQRLVDRLHESGIL